MHLAFELGNINAPTDVPLSRKQIRTKTVHLLISSETLVGRRSFEGLVRLLLIVFSRIANRQKRLEGIELSRVFGVYHNYFRKCLECLMVIFGWEIDIYNTGTTRMVVRTFKITIIVFACSRTRESNALSCVLELVNINAPGRPREVHVATLLLGKLIFSSLEFLSVSWRSTNTF